MNLTIKLIFILAISLISTVSANEEAKNNYYEYKKKKALEISIKSKTRYRKEEDKERAQQQFKIKFKYNIENSNWEVHGVVRTGKAFNSNYDTFYDFEAEEDASNYDPLFNLSHFYLKNSQLKDGKIALELGAIPTDKGIQKVTALDSGGYIDGARTKIKTKYGEVTIAGGSLGAEDDPSLFERSHDLNYFEIRVNKDFLDKFGAEKIQVQAGIVHFEDENYFSQVVKARYNAFSNRILTIVQESMWDSEGEFKHGLGIEGDLMNLIAGVEPKSNGIKVGLRHLYMTDDLGEFGHLSSGFYDVPGHSIILEVKKKIKISKDKNTSVEIGYRGRVGIDHDEDEYRHEAYISITHKF